MFYVPFALPERPAGDDPEGDHEHQQDGAGADGHQCLQDEPRVKVDAVKCTDRPTGSVREQLAVQQHDAADEVETEEHGQGEGHVVRHPLGPDLATLVGQLRGPQEVVLARDGVDGTDDQLHGYLSYPLPRHRYPPVVRAVVDHKQLQQK